VNTFEFKLSNVIFFCNLDIDNFPFIIKFEFPIDNFPIINDGAKETIKDKIDKYYNIEIEPHLILISLTI
jgi:hypothetical protein